MSDDSLEREAAKAAKQRLTDACRTKDTSLRLAWAITVGEGLLLATVAVALMDYWLMLPVWMRSIGAAGIAVMAMLGIYRLVRFIRRPTRLKEVALDVEAAKPELGCDLSTAAEYLSGERQPRHQYEPELVAALEAKAAQELRSAPLPYERRCVWPAVVLALTFLGLLVFLAIKPVSFTALRRIVLPFSEARYTQVEVKPGNADIPLGHNVEITSSFTGRAPTDPQLHWQEKGRSEWQTIPLTTRSDDGSYVHVLPSLSGDIRYRVTGSDAVCDTYELTAYVPPEVKDLAIQIAPPTYTQLEAAYQTSLEISALRASSVEIQIAPSVKLSAAKLRVGSGPEELTLQPSGEGLWKGNFPVNTNAEYWIELFDEKGRRGAHEKPVQITAVPDQPPVVEIPDPGQDMRASATTKLPIRISVTDDFGVEDIQLVFHKLGSAEQSVAVIREQTEKGEVMARVELDLAALSLAEYDVVSYQAVAKDNNTLDGPGVGKSPVYFVEISDRERLAGKPKGQGQQLNLLAIQKQIIADTTAVPGDASLEKFNELAARQQAAADFGEIYAKALAGTGAPPAAIAEMEAALRQMTTASGYLAERKRGAAIPPEESALASLYQVLKQLPDLQDMPIQPNPQQPPPLESPLAVVLEAIQQKKEQPENESVEDALQQAQQLASLQASLNEALRKADPASAQPQPGAQQRPAQDQGQAALGQGQPQAQAQSQAQGQGQGQGEGEGEGQGKGKGKGKGQGKPSAQPQDPNQPGQKQSQDDAEGESKDEAAGTGDDPQIASGKGAGKKQPSSSANQGKGTGEAQARDGQSGKSGDNGESGSDLNEDPITDENAVEDPLELAQQEQELSKEAAALAEKLQRLSSRDRRVGKNAGQNANLAGHKLATAATEIKRGLFGAAGVNGAQGELALRKVVAELRQVVQERPELSDVASEDAPKEYEALISEYFKKLSHAE